MHPIKPPILSKGDGGGQTGQGSEVRLAQEEEDGRVGEESEDWQQVGRESTPVGGARGSGLQQIGERTTGEGRYPDVTSQSSQRHSTQNELEEGVVMWNGTNKPIMICNNPACCRIYESSRRHMNKKCCSQCRKGWGHSPRCQNNHNEGIISARTWHSWASRQGMNGSNLLDKALKKIPVKNSGVKVC